MLGFLDLMPTVVVIVGRFQGQIEETELPLGKIVVRMEVGHFQGGQIRIRMGIVFLYLDKVVVIKS